MARKLMAHVLLLHGKGRVPRLFTGQIIRTTIFSSLLMAGCDTAEPPSALPDERAAVAASMASVGPPIRGLEPRVEEAPRLTSKERFVAKLDGAPAVVVGVFDQVSAREAIAPEGRPYLVTDVSFVVDRVARTQSKTTAPVSGSRVTATLLGGDLGGRSQRVSHGAPLPRKGQTAVLFLSNVSDGSRLELRDEPASIGLLEADGSLTWDGGAVDHEMVASVLAGF